MLILIQYTLNMSGEVLFPVIPSPVFVVMKW